MLGGHDRGQASPPVEDAEDQPRVIAVAFGLGGRDRPQRGGGGAPGAGHRREYPRGQQDHHPEGAWHPPTPVRKHPEQGPDQPRLLQHIAHENVERDARELEAEALSPRQAGEKPQPVEALPDDESGDPGREKDEGHRQPTDQADQQPPDEDGDDGAYVHSLVSGGFGAPGAGRPSIAQ